MHTMHTMLAHFAKPSLFPWLPVAMESPLAGSLQQQGSTSSAFTACLPACLPACLLPAACRPPDCLAARLPTYLPTYLPTFTESNNHHHLDHTILYWLSGLPNMACLAGTALLVIASTVAVFVASNTQ